ncbi:hypothetical protein K505DRAFT_354571 [Melanomma pulvis-pyrius CBS 109.77]|uniref:ER-bound oxygenase mpaB/mpaB'/Rubber oxygenase catalytic domain-containing protein n=1 Tax=Melanomma pulvis-pyrius CBS 109.77 TaxID=1314802 RepID=A0A6A6WQQ0_9PLEO|nr:hypothetical protein K505DRAFT_354571 [Melanomma pulvis-pyrius CBS 109.77]
MTSVEALNIMVQLQTLEFPYAMNKARSVALLKAGGIPTMSKLFAVTGNNNRKNAGKRATDTEILLREAQTQPRSSDRYMTAVARMNYLHSRYRQAGKILDEDLLHTLGDGAAEIVNVVDREEWRKLTDVEKCAIGVYHHGFGEDLEIPFTPLESSQCGWRDGLHFLTELVSWTLEYEKRVAHPTATADQYVKAYVDSATSSPRAIRFLRGYVALSLDDTMRESLCLEPPGPFLSGFSHVIHDVRKLLLRHFALPRSQLLAVEIVAAHSNEHGLYNFNHFGFQPWYKAATFWSKWRPSSLLLQAFGARTPGSQGERFKPKGYDLGTIGPAPQEGKGLDEMRTTVEYMKSRGPAECPFAGMKQRKSAVIHKHSNGS